MLTYADVCWRLLTYAILGDALDECGDNTGTLEAYKQSVAIAEEMQLWDQAITRHHKVPATHADVC